MKVLVCGAGRVGYNIAKHLSAQHNDVTVIDTSGELIRQINQTLDVQAVEGHASDPDTLDRANAANAEMIIAVTLSDEVNMVACQIAHSLFNVPLKIARIRNQGYLRKSWADLFNRDNMPIDVVISPEVEVARAIARRLMVPGAFDIIPLADDRVRVVGVKLDSNCPVLETPLRQLEELFPDLDVTVMGIVRGETMIVPTGDDSMFDGDRIYFAVKTPQMRRALSVFGHEEDETTRVIVVGGGNVGLFLARDLAERAPRIKVTIIEESRERAEFISDKVSKAIVLNGDALEPEILDQANVASADTVVAVADEDEINILASLLAKSRGAGRAITLVNNATFANLIGPLGVDVTIDPRETTVSTILQQIRRGRIRGLYSLQDGSAEVIEAEALETSPIVGKSISDIRRPSDLMFGAVLRDGEVIAPRADTVFRAHDKVVMFANGEAVHKVEQLFAVRLEFF